MKIAAKMIVLCTLLLSLSAGGCTWAEIRFGVAHPTPVPLLAETPVDWKTIETEFFTFALPPDFTQQQVQGIDTQVWHYVGDNMSFSIEVGMYASDFTFERDRYESIVDEVQVNGISAHRIVLDLNKPILNNWAVNADGSTKIEPVVQNLVLGLYFPSKESRFWLTRSPRVPQKTAETILGSIRFKD